MTVYCVTGGAGFIGSHIVDALLIRNCTVVVIDDFSTGDRKNLNDNAIIIDRSITQPLEDVFATYHFDYVFHTAAQINLRYSMGEPQADAMTNVIGSLNLLENCVRHKVKRFIFSSTGGAIYSPDEPLPFTENSRAIPESPYGISKLTVENYLHFFNRIHRLPSTILRYSNVFGPRQNSKGEAGVISIFTEKALRNENLTIFGDGDQTRDFVYVNDVVSANLLALYLELDGVFNVSSNTQTSVNDIANKILNTIQGTSKVVYDNPVPGELLHTKLCSDKLQMKGWVPKWDIDSGIQKTIEYFKGLK